MSKEQDTVNIAREEQVKRAVEDVFPGMQPSGRVSLTSDSNLRMLVDREISAAFEEVQKLGLKNDGPGSPAAIEAALRTYRSGVEMGARLVLGDKVVSVLLEEGSL